MLSQNSWDLVFSNPLALFLLIIGLVLVLSIVLAPPPWQLRSEARLAATSNTIRYRETHHTSGISAVIMTLRVPGVEALRWLRQQCLAEKTEPSAADFNSLKPCKAHLA